MLPLLMSLIPAAWAAPANDTGPVDFCGTFVHHEHAFLENPPPSPPTDDNGKSLRSYFPPAPHVRTSEHFAVHWGDEVEFTEADAEFLLVTMETAWDTFVGDYGHTPPKDADLYYLNAYVAGSFEGAPPAIGGTAYHTTDPDGYSFLVYNAERLLTERSWVEFVGTHAVYHAMQYAGSPRAWGVQDHWWLEATAQSMSWRALDDESWAIDRLHAFAFYPHLGLSSWERLDYDDTSSMHRYGAYIFVDNLIDVSGTDAVVQTFTERSDAGPFDQVRGILADDGADVDRIWMDTLSRNLTWDYDNGDAYAAHMQEHADDPDAAFQFAVLVPSGGTEQMQAAPELLLPGAYGANYLRWDDPVPGRYAVHLQLHAMGSAETADHRLAATLVTQNAAGDASYQELPTDDKSARAEVQIEDDVTRAWVVVGVLTGTPELKFYEPETFPYTWQVEALPPVDPVDPIDPEPRGGCGCDQSGNPAGWLWLGAPLLWLGRRRLRNRSA